MALHESGEMYLETILILSHKGPVHAIDVGDYMGFSKPSVSRAVGLLKKGEFVTTDTDGSLLLTETGRATAEKIYERHVMLTRFLTALGVDEKTAAEDACKIEHDISDASFETIKKHVASRKLQ